MAGDDGTRTNGMADAGRERIAGMVLPAWDAFLTQAEDVDLSRRSRLPGWRAQEICVHLGLLPEDNAMGDLVAPAPAGGRGAPPAARAARRGGGGGGGGRGAPGPPPARGGGGFLPLAARQPGGHGALP